MKFLYTPEVRLVSLREMTPYGRFGYTNAFVELPWSVSRLNFHSSFTLVMPWAFGAIKCKLPPVKEEITGTAIHSLIKSLTAS